jgi:S1-C subfamily serine protease
MSPRRIKLAVLAAVAAAGVGTADEGALSRAELAKRGKPAAVMVLAEGASGTAFAVHPDGLFVTNEHVARAGGPAGRVRVALRAGEPGQKVLTARVVRADKDRDLALLKVDGEKGLPALPLGDSDKLTELTELVGFGFPLGTRLAANQGDLPTITVTVSSVTALRRKGGALAAIQLDGAISPGHSGGPLLAPDGSVVAVIVSGYRGTQINQAIPANVVKEFLAAPDIAFTPPKLDPRGLGRPAEFRAEVVSALPGAKPPAVELVLDTGDGPPRKVPMELRDGAYRATAVPVPRTSPETVTLSARFGPVTVSGPVPDRECTVGGKAVKLSELRRLETGAGPRAVRHDGTTLTGAVGGLDGVELKVADRSVSLDLTKADAVEFTPPTRPTTLTCTVIATAGGKEVARSTAAVPLPGATAARPATAAAGPPAYTVRIPPAEQAVLPGPVTDACVGGGGRYLIFRTAGTRAAAVFDVQQGKVAKEIPLSEDGCHIAASANRLVIVYPNAKLIQLWSLATLERERSSLLPAALTSDAIHQVCMGSASAGPLFVYLPKEKRTLAVDLDSLKTTEVKWTHWSPDNAYGPLEMRVAPDGTLLVGWGGGWAGCEVAYFRGGVQVGSNPKIEFSAIGRGVFALPTADGRLVLTPWGFVDRAGGAAREAGLKDAYLVPSVEPGFFLAFGRTRQPPADVAAYTDDRERLFTLTGLDELKPDAELAWEKRVFYYPRSGLLVTVGAGKDRLALRRVDLAEQLERSGADYLVVTSRPPEAARGRRFVYAPLVLSKKGGVKLRLESGPNGMELADGRLSWEVPASYTGLATVVLAVSDASGREVLHSFTLGPGSGD